MSNEHIEYDRDVNPYPSFGKKYNGEKAIISLTSWKARINTVAKTLYSLIKQCPGFHIVLVLSEEEFPQKEKALPENLMLLVNNKFIELLWVYKNYKSLKKVLFTMDKYREVPVISADDDCIYTCNYAKLLYDEWKNNKSCFVTLRDAARFRNTICQNGPCSLYPPYFYKEYGLNCLTNRIIQRNQDDVYCTVLRSKLKLCNYRKLNLSIEQILIYSAQVKPLHDIYNKCGYNDNTIRICDSEIAI